MSKPAQKKRFIDITLDTPKGSATKKRRLEELIKTVEVDANNSFEIIYQTPMARMKINKRTIRIQVDCMDTVPETPNPVSSSTVMSSSSVIQFPCTDITTEVTAISDPPIAAYQSSGCIFTEDIFPETPFAGYVVSSSALTNFSMCCLSFPSHRSHK